MDYIGVAAAARQLGISEHAIRQRAYRGSLPSRREGGRLLIGVSQTQDTEISHETSRERRDETPRDIPVTDGAPWIETVATTITLLHNQLSVKDEQIVSLNQTVEDMRHDHARQINELHVLLQNTQRLIPATVPDASHPPEQSGERESRIEHEHTARRGAQREPEASWRVRLWRWLGWE